MRKMIIAALTASAMTPAQAAVYFEIDANLTTRRSPGVGDPSYPLTSGPTGQHFSLSGDSLASAFDMNRLPLGFGAGSACGSFGRPCIDLARSGDTWTFSSPLMAGAYQSLGIVLKFSEDVDGEPLDQAMAKFVSGTFNWAYGHHNGQASASGQIVGIAAFVPEPAAWTLMIGGFALTGAAMRRRRMTLAFS